MPDFVKPRILGFLLPLTLLFQSGCVRSGKRAKERDGNESDRQVVIDPGHGGVDGGACPDGVVPEKEIVLDIALEVRRFLEEKRVPVVLTRESDEFIPLWKRAKIANDLEAALLVSIHANSCHSKNVDGFEVYCADNQWQEESIRAAEYVQRSLEAATGATNRGIRKQRYTVLWSSRCPAVLVEVGYLSNPREANLLSEASYREKVAMGIAEGVMAYVEARH